MKISEASGGIAWTEGRRRDSGPVRQIQETVVLNAHSPFGSFWSIKLGKIELETTVSEHDNQILKQIHSKKRNERGLHRQQGVSGVMATAA